jgi:hypothetical protein
LLVDPLWQHRPNGRPFIIREYETVEKSLVFSNSNGEQLAWGNHRGNPPGDRPKTAQVAISAPARGHLRAVVLPPQPLRQLGDIERPGDDEPPESVPRPRAIAIEGRSEQRHTDQGADK